MNISRAFATVIACCLMSMAAVAADSPEPTTQAAIDQLRSRLNLTPEQEAKIKPLAEARRTELEGVRTRMQGATTRRDKAKVMRDAQQAQDKYVSAVTPLLTPDQQAEWKKIREEGKEQMKERARERKQ